ncbi:hypothetical protein ZWY2020_031829, partial [Hordeum vulgare]
APWCVCWGAWVPSLDRGELWRWRRAADLDGGAAVPRWWWCAVVVVDLRLLLRCAMGSTIWVGRNPCFDEADNGDTCGRRSLPEGVVLDQIGLPCSSSGETLGPSFGPDDGGTKESLPS